MPHCCLCLSALRSGSGRRRAIHWFSIAIVMFQSPSSVSHCRLSVSSLSHVSKLPPPPTEVEGLQCRLSFFRTSPASNNKLVVDVSPSARKPGDGQTAPVGIAHSTGKEPVMHRQEIRQWRPPPPFTTPLPSLTAQTNTTASPSSHGCTTGPHEQAK